MTTMTKHVTDVIDYYENTTDYYMKSWSEDHFHFGIFEPDELSELKKEEDPNVRRIIRAKAYDRMVEEVISSLNMTPECTVVDAGCGIGGATFYYAKNYNCTAIGLNVSEKQLEIARKRSVECNLHEKVDFRFADCSEELPFEDESVDVVTCIEAACHFEDRRKFLSECIRILKPGGYLSTIEWLAKDDISKENYKRYIKPICDTWVLSTLESRNSHASLLKEAGFKLTKDELLEDEKVIENAHKMKIGYDMLVEASNKGAKLSKSDLLWQGSLLSLSEAWLNGYFKLGHFIAQK